MSEIKLTQRLVKHLNEESETHSERKVSLTSC